MIAAVALGFTAAPARAERGISLDEDVYVGVAGERVVEIGPNATTSSCEFNAVRKLLCAALFALTPVKVDLGSQDGTRVRVSVDAHPAPAPTGP
jgi:hypothetical protein